MRLRTFLADLLSNVPSLQTFDQLSPKQERYEHRRDRSISRSKSDVLKNVQRLYEIPILIFEAAIDQFVKDVIDHFVSRPWSVVNGQLAISAMQRTTDNRLLAIH